MPKVSPRGQRIFGRVPTAVNVLGSALLITQIVVGISLATSSDTPEPGPAAVTPPAPPVPPTPPEPEIAEVPTPEPPSPTPSPTLQVERIAEGEIVRLKRYPGQGSAVIGQVRDKKARLTFVELGKPWGRSKPLGTGPIVDGTYTRRQTFVTEEYGPDLDRQWWADIDSYRHTADLTPGDSMYEIVAGFLDARQDGNFPSGTAGVDVASYPVKNGWVIVREMHMPESDAGRKARVELAAVVALDTGSPRPGILWITIPDTHKRLWPDIGRVIRSVRVFTP
ncbi:hypothetical protein Aph01nite_37820 [Acrocarpospora phusangensis]|uniref:Uncharacterized protein n=1 Tax=Acrocarpospora phusangensis TaxID=1070424 RepID=A0A919UPB0_9ACTN|nr:hypothetical protein [Acrocarpospora phusangensis]GIH25472.1 hypothetical protein Aph01nite_37820 [Acrocarpospora phusangensis]